MYQTSQTFSTSSMHKRWTPSGKKTANTVEKPNSQYSSDSYGILISVSALYSVLQPNIPAVLRPPTFAPLSLLTIYWPHRRKARERLDEASNLLARMPNYVYENVRGCQSCAIIQKTYNRQRELRLFPDSGLLQFVSIDILCATKTRGRKIVQRLVNR